MPIAQIALLAEMAPGFGVRDKTAAAEVEIILRNPVDHCPQCAGVCRGIDDGGGLLIETETGRTGGRSGSLTPPGGEWRGGDSGA